MRRTVLFADNERGIRQFCKQELEAAGYRVLLARDGAEALEVLDGFAADLIILDEHMPRCDGLEAARHIKQGHPNVPVILFTADQYYQGYRSPLVDATVIKSDDLTSLMAAVVEHLPDAHVTPSETSTPQLCGSLEADLECH